MNILIQKFGGSSLSTPEQREMAAGKVRDALKEGYAPVVVVSAMGRAGAAYATDTLIQLCKAEHADPHPRALDMAMACGELLSTVVFAGVLWRQGYEAVPMSGGQAGIVTDDHFGNAAVLGVNPERLKGLLAQGRIPVVAGFQGHNAAGDFTTLGRGGSDTTASLLGEALSAVCVEVYTDVDGIMTADPRVVPEAKVLRHIGYGEVFQMADSGARVIHPGAVAVAMRAGIPLVVRNTQNDLPGTIISNKAGLRESQPVASITAMTKRCQVELPLTPTARQGLLEDLAQHGVSIDLINIFPERLVFTVGEDDCDKLLSLCNDIGIDTPELRRDCTKVSAVGEGMRGVPGVMVRILRALEAADIPVLQTADSHSTISCLVASEQAQEAVRALHDAFCGGSACE